MARPITTFREKTRLQMFAQNHLGVLYMGGESAATKVFRDPLLDVLDAYYDGRQYDGLEDWDASIESGNYVAIRKRKPRINYRLGKVVVDKVASKLVGSQAFPNFIIEDEDDDTAFFRAVQKACSYRRKMIEPMKHFLISGGVFITYELIDGSPIIDFVKSKFCYPVFNRKRELESVEVKYVYEDPNDRDAKGNPKLKWYKKEYSRSADILFDNPEYRPGAPPSFSPVSSNNHNLGWVQGEWLCDHEDGTDYDGIGLIYPIMDFIDELCYSLSQSSQASSYSQEPQLAINKVDEDEIEMLIKSSEKAWNLGREGEAKYLEVNGKGVELATAHRDKMLHLALQVVRVVLNDPEKMTATAQSGEALKVLCAPLVELVDELRAILERPMTNLLIKIGMTLLHYGQQGFETALTVPEGYVPTSLDITVQWPPIFPPTLQDINLMAQSAQSLSQGKIISRESLTRWIAHVIPSIDNVEEELEKIHEEPMLNPFGDFGSLGSPPPPEKKDGK